MSLKAGAISLYNWLFHVVNATATTFYGCQFELNIAVSVASFYTFIQIHISVHSQSSFPSPLVNLININHYVREGENL